ncbi:hypothetical protein CEXT_465571 [Caerostris extrusa]|uniref:Uncharacterized protein n=1 Tax=Caerostris extrusa TaxID=172846 RepID=A0AAV4NPG4_CAEEX|nr:hypothetical protein CEXT_465571 [Caerostris extrusa]
MSSALTSSEIFSKLIPDSELPSPEPNGNDPSGQNSEPLNPLEDVTALTSSEIFSKFIPDLKLRIAEPNENDPSRHVDVFGRVKLYLATHATFSRMIYSARGRNCRRLIAPHPSYLCQFVQPEGREGNGWAQDGGLAGLRKVPGDGWIKCGKASKG